MKITLLNLIVFLALLTSGTTFGIKKVSAKQPDKITDGPYVSYANNSDSLKFVWLCDGELKQKNIKPSSLVTQFSECGLKADIPKHFSVTPPKSVELTKAKIAAISDIHGQIHILKTLLTKHAITDKAGNWIFNDGHLVITGDIFDRGDNVTEILWFLFELEQQAELSGGKLHLLLGNHEVMVLTNDLRYLSDKYLLAEKLLNQSMTELYAPTSILGTWLRSKNVVLKLNDMVFLHGGLHPELVDKSLSLADINQLFRLYLSEETLDEVDKNIAEYLHGIDGPIWYRGYFNEEHPIDLGKLTDHFKVSKFIVGHTSQEKIETRYKNTVIAIDSSIKYGNNGELLLIEDEKFYRGLLNGKVEQLF